MTMDHREIVEAYIAGVQRGDVDALVALFHEDAEIFMPLFDEPVVGIEPIRAFFEDLVGRWTTRIELTVDAIAVDGDVGMFEFTFAMALPGGGQHVAASVDVFHFEGGLVRKLRAYTDGGALRDAFGMA
jgi:ketosteroid isomerase-like protein